MIHATSGGKLQEGCTKAGKEVLCLKEESGVLKLREANRSLIVASMKEDDNGK